MPAAASLDTTPRTPPCSAVRVARASLVVVLLAVVWSAGAVAQDPAVTAALELERGGRPREAADRFVAALERDPSNAVALLGLERSLQAINELERVFPVLARAYAARPADVVAHGIELRALAALGRETDLADAAERWIAAAPDDAEPWHQWAFVVAQRGNLPAARAILLRGQDAIGGAALRTDLAQLAVATGSWVEAARNWHAASVANRAVISASGISLSQAPPEQRPAVLQLLLGELGDSTARLIAADVLVGWGRAGEAWTLLDANLPAAPVDAIAVLRRFGDRARQVGTPEASRARGYAFERLADYQGGAAGQRARIEAARAFADAGDRAAAERVLGRIAMDPSTAPPGTGDALAALIGLMADAGRPADAQRRLDAWRSAIPESEREQLRRRIARAWAYEGELGLADSLLGADSTVEASALRGWIALFRGELATAVASFRDAGPFAGTRDEATRRTVAAALAQRVGLESAPPVGAAFLALERGDTATAITRFATLAPALGSTDGRADVLAFAGQLSLRSGDARALALLQASLAADSTGPAAPAAELGLAELAWRAGDAAEARRRLERLILAYPESAVVPEARRLLDRVRGGVPNS